MKIYLSPSNQKSNIYYDGKTTEKEVCAKIAMYIETALSGYQCEVKICSSDEYEDRWNEASQFKPDLYFALHTNAGGGVGAVCFYHPEQYYPNLAEALCDAANKNAPLKSTRSQSVQSGMNAFNGYGYGEIREPAKRGMKPVLLEVNFHDNAILGEWIKNHTDSIGYDIAMGLADYFKIEKNVVIKDGQPDDYAKESIDKAIKAGVLKGDGNGNFNLKGNITRQDMLVILDRLGLIK